MHYDGVATWLPKSTKWKFKIIFKINNADSQLKVTKKKREKNSHKLNRLA